MSIFQPVTWLGCIDSTNTYLLSLARAGAPHGTVIAAREQTGGRGRLGRSFLSPRGGLYMSLLLRDIPYGDCTVMTAAAAVAFRRALQSFSPDAVSIKWVNDLLVGGKKLAGILAEGVISPAGQLGGMVIGIGVNLGEVPEGVADIACALPGCVTPEECANALCRALEDILAMPLEAVMAEYRAHCTAIGRRVTVVSAAGEYEAQAVDTDNRARLICLTDDGRRVVLDSGEIRIRL